MKQNRRESGKIAAKYVAEKLNERGYSVQIGKRGVGLTVESPTGTAFAVKVTSLSSPNAWIIPAPEKQDSYFVLVFKPDDSPPAFFILAPDEMRKERDNHINSMKKPINEYSNPELERKGLSFKQPFPYEDKWASLPG